jgi:DNA invertase Pin-like site-specific DNA recombinase
MIGNDKITAVHRERLAFVYARQSTPAQVVQHRSSTERQLGLADHAMEMGWARGQVIVVDEDLGRSAKTTDGRQGFQRMAGEMTMGRVGAVFSLDASRLARSSADWHRLLEIAALTRTLLVDEQTVYDPRDPNDRLVLGMKGTMADFELVWLRQRMEGGRWHLARRGAYRRRPAIGYIYEDDDATRFAFDPDEEIRRAVELLFARFRVAGSIADVIKHFAAHGLSFPARFGKRVDWARLTHSRAHQILTNPMYAGAYVFGRAKGETTLEQGTQRRRVRKLPRSEWPVMIRDAHPAYITWEEYLANEKRMSENGARRRGNSSPGAVREGRALLQGLLLCDHCSSRLQVRYSGQSGRYPVYQCSRLTETVMGGFCLGVHTRNLDEPIVDLVFGMLTQPNLLDATRVVEIIDEEHASLDRQWALRLERARYDAKRAERQYDACDPDNRVVARTLEKRWNERLTEVERLEREYDEFKRAQRFELSDLDRQRIMQLAADLPRLWQAKATEDRDRKLLLRLLIKDVSVRAVDVPRPALRVKVLWHTHAVTELEVERLGRGANGRKVIYGILGTIAPEAKTNRQSP